MLFTVGSRGRRIGLFWAIGSHGSRRWWLVAGTRAGIWPEVFDAEGDPLPLRVNRQDDHFYPIADVVMGDCLFAWDRPIEIFEVNDSVDSCIQGDEEPYVGNYARNVARDSFATMIFGAKVFPWVRMVHVQEDNLS